MSQSADDAFAEEIVEIFVEEVGEVLQQIDDNFSLWENNSGNETALKEVRRAFHTLKGSGRMVHAEEIGELAWAVENMLNRVIDHTLKANGSIFQLVSEVRKIVPAMIDAFRNKQAAALSGVNFTQMIDQANAIVQGRPVASITSSAPQPPEISLERPMPSSMSAMDMVEIETLKERVAELSSTVDEIRRSFIRASTQLDSLSVQVKQMPKAVDPVAINRQMEKADQEIRELKYFMKASSEQMIAEMNNTQKRLSAKVDNELKSVGHLREQVNTDINMVSAELRTELGSMIKIWSLASAMGFSLAVFLFLLAR